jgi:mRNA interferase RelE/StbE
VYKLIIDPKALDFLEKLPKTIAQRIFKKIQQTKEGPHHYFTRLVSRPEYKLRVGDYRIIAEIKDNELIVFVIDVDHRKKVYKKK